MTVADLVFYDVPGRGDVSAKIAKYDDEYQASVLDSVGRYSTLLDALVGVRKYLDVISCQHRDWQKRK